MIESGLRLTFDGEWMRTGKRVPGDPVLVDGSPVGEVGPLVMPQGGFVTAIAL